MQNILKSGLFILLMTLSTSGFATDRQTVSTTFQNDNTVLVVQTGGKSTPIKLNATATTVFVDGAYIYVAQGNAGGSVYKVNHAGKPIFQKSLTPNNGNAVGFFKTGQTVWMEVNATSAVPVNAGAQSSPGPAAGPSTQVTPATTEAHSADDEAKPLYTTEKIEIVQIHRGQVKLNIGAKHGVKTKDQFVVYKLEAVEKKGIGVFKGKKEVATLVVTAVNEDHCLAQLARGDRVKKGFIVEPRKKQDISNVYPRKLANTGEINLSLRPLLNVNGKKGVGALFDVTAAFWGKHYFINLRMQPMGLGTTRDGDIVTGSVLAEGGYDSRAFAVGIGAGVGLVNGNMDRMMGKWETENEEHTTKGAFALSQTVRLGSRDGLNFTAYNTFLYYNDRNAENEDEDDSGFIYGGTIGRLNIPLNSKVTLYLNGGGGRMGYGFGELGISTWIIGNGDAGSLALSAAAGGAGIWVKSLDEDDYFSTTEVAGPLVSLGLTYRFGLFR